MSQYRTKYDCVGKFAHIQRATGRLGSHSFSRAIECHRATERQTGMTKTHRLTTDRATYYFATVAAAHQFVAACAAQDIAAGYTTGFLRDVRVHVSVTTGIVRERADVIARGIDPTAFVAAHLFAGTRVLGDALGSPNVAAVSS